MDADTESHFSGVSAWVNYLKAKRLPVSAQTGLAMQLSSKDSRSNTAQFSKLVLQDPVAIFYTIRSFGQLKINSFKNEKKNVDLEQAIGIMGFSRLEELSQQFELIEPHYFQKNACYAMVLQASMHAAIQAREWSDHRQSATSQLVFIAALLHDIAAWFLGYFKPELIQIIYEKARATKTELTTLEKEILGCTIEEISYELAVYWNLPEIVTDCIDPEKADKLALISFQATNNIEDIATQIRLRDLRNQETIAAKCAAKMARIICYKGWDLGSLQEYLDKVMIYLNLDQEYTLKFVRKCAVIASREYTLPGALSPASELILISETDQESSTEKSLKDFNLLAEGKLKLLKLENKKTYHELIDLALQLINQGIGLERAVAILLSSDKKLLVVRHSQGVSNSDMLKDVVIRLDEPHLFNFLMKASKSIWIDSHNYKEFEGLIPKSLRDLGVLKYFFAVPITVQGKSIGFILCDRNADQSKALMPEQYNAFKEVVSALMQSLKLLSEIKSK